MVFLFVKIYDWIFFNRIDSRRDTIDLAKDSVNIYIETQVIKLNIWFWMLIKFGTLNQSKQPLDYLGTSLKIIQIVIWWTSNRFFLNQIKTNSLLYLARRLTQNNENNWTNSRINLNYRHYSVEAKQWRLIFHFVCCHR